MGGKLPIVVGNETLRCIFNSHNSSPVVNSIALLPSIIISTSKELSVCLFDLQMRLFCSLSCHRVWRIICTCDIKRRKSFSLLKQSRYYPSLSWVVAHQIFWQKRDYSINGVPWISKMDLKYLYHLRHLHMSDYIMSIVFSILIKTGQFLIFI